MPFQKINLKALQWTNFFTIKKPVNILNCILQPSMAFSGAIPAWQ